MGPLTVLIVVWVCNGLAILCAASRFAILSRRPKTTRILITHPLLFMAVVLDLVGSSIGTYILVNEIRLLRENNNDNAIVEKLMAADPIYAKLSFWGHFAYWCGMAFLKAAYLVYYSVMYNRLERKKKVFLYTAVTLLAFSIIAGFFILFLWCKPFSDNWNPNRHPDSHCPVIYTVTGFVAISTMNIVTDFAILVVPLFVISTIHFRSGLEKSGLALIFVLGGTSLAASLTRFVLVYRVLAKNAMNNETTHSYVLWSHWEVFFGVLAFTLPSLRYVMFKTRVGTYLSGSKAKGTQEMENLTSSSRKRTRSSVGMGLDDEGISMETIPSLPQWETRERPWNGPAAAEPPK